MYLATIQLAWWNALFPGVFSAHEFGLLSRKKITPYRFLLKGITSLSA